MLLRPRPERGKGPGDDIGLINFLLKRGEILPRAKVL